MSQDLTASPDVLRNDALLVTAPEQLEASWLSQVLGRPVDDVRAVKVGTGQIGSCYRVSYSADGVDASVLVKLPAEDPAARTLLAGAYRSEVRFYSEIAATVAIRVPACHLAASSPDGSDFTLVLEDLAPAKQGDQLRGCNLVQAFDAAANLAGLHGPRWCDPTLLDIEGLALNTEEDAALLGELYGPAAEIVIDALGDKLEPLAVEVLRGVGTVVARWALGRSERFGLVHGDYRLDNLMFRSTTEPESSAVDWQTLSLALPARDLGFFMGTSLDPLTRKWEGQRIVRAYHEALLSHGVKNYDLKTCWSDYRYSLIQGPLVSVFGHAYGTRTERGDEMFAVMLNRSCRAIDDHRTIDMVVADEREA